MWCTLSKFKVQFQWTLIVLWIKTGREGLEAGCRLLGYHTPPFRSVDQNSKTMKKRQKEHVNPSSLTIYKTRQIICAVTYNSLTRLSPDFPPPLLRKSLDSPLLGVSPHHSIFMVDFLTVVVLQAFHVNFLLCFAYLPGPLQCSRTRQRKCIDTFTSSTAA